MHRRSIEDQIPFAKNLHLKASLKMRAFLPLLSLASAVQALHFYVDPATPKCFFEDLPKGTLVVGHYTAQEWDDRSDVWQEHTGISIYISVDVRRLT